MTDDLVRRLRDWKPKIAVGYHSPAAANTIGEAADCIEELLKFKSLHAACDKVSLDIEQKLVNQLAATHKRNKELEAALLEADQFITNGIELGYIRMPDADVPDAAHHIPGNIRSVLAGEKKDG